MKFLSLISCPWLVFISSCERQDFEETRKLHDKPSISAPVEDEPNENDG